MEGMKGIRADRIDGDWGWVERSWKGKVGGIEGGDVGLRETMGRRRAEARALGQCTGCRCLRVNAADKD